MLSFEIDQKYVREVISPTWERITACIVLAAILLASPSYYLVANHLTARIIAQESDVIIHHLLHIAGRYAFVNTLVIVLFWGSVALLLYLCYWIISSAITSTYNEVSIDSNYANIGSWQDRLSGPITKACGVLALLSFLIVTWVVYGKMLVPFTASLAHWQPRHLMPELIYVLLLALIFYLIRIFAILVFSIE